MAHFEIPRFLSHLPVDDRGYPIAFFVPVIDGKPDFKTMDPAKQLIAVKKKLCGICGKPLEGKHSYVISGPVGLQNRAVSDPPMHRECAEFSMQACPHIYFEKAQRKVDGPSDSVVIHEKPPFLLVIRITSCELVKANGVMIIRFAADRYRKYNYTNGKIGPSGNWIMC